MCSCRWPRGYRHRRPARLGRWRGMPWSSRSRRRHHSFLSGLIGESLADASSPKQIKALNKKTTTNLRIVQYIIFVCIIFDHFRGVQYIVYRFRSLYNVRSVYRNTRTHYPGNSQEEGYSGGKSGAKHSPAGGPRNYSADDAAQSYSGLCRVHIGLILLVSL